MPPPFFLKMSEEAIDSLIETLQISEIVDTKKDREDWGKSMQHLKDKAAEAKESYVRYSSHERRSHEWYHPAIEIHENNDHRRRQWGWH